MNFRLLRPEEYPRLASIFESLGTPLPDPDRGQVIVGEENGEIVVAAPIQMVGMLSLWIHPDHRGGGHYKDVAQAADLIAQQARLTGYVFTTSNDKVKTMATNMGFTEIPDTLFVRKF